ncbi:hypothetical protein HRI_002736100 [Hibiscus trionum]|uniref:Reverse transcriptase zinc-binding domain-containing protein n=1 Tax=Hibiscus trionum TaxID=183268 RepID=A0A9W7IA22_HIBTR|nr:hypothetical protein HRI_002736100 [Hibiscus trionum]
MPQSVADLLLMWWENRPYKSRVSIWNFVPAAVIWFVWLLRNEIVFNNCKLDSIQLLFLIKFRIASWFKARFRDSSSSIEDIVLHPPFGRFGSV